MIPETHHDRSAGSAFRALLYACERVRLAAAIASAPDPVICYIDAAPQAVIVPLVHRWISVTLTRFASTLITKRGGRLEYRRMIRNDQDEKERRLRVRLETGDWQEIR